VVLYLRRTTDEIARAVVLYLRRTTDEIARVVASI
jgi:hypothetical protein